MQYSDTFRNIVENKLKKEKNEKWTFFDDSIPEDERSPLDPPVKKSKTHPLELSEEDRLFSRVSDWNEKFKEYERRKKRKERDEQWKHMSQPLTRQESSTGASPGLSSAEFSSLSPSMERTASSPFTSTSASFSVHRARNSLTSSLGHRESPQSSRVTMTGVPQTNGKRWLQHKRNQQKLHQPESKYKCVALPLNHVGEPELVFSGSNFKGDSVVLLRRRDLMFVKDGKAAFIPLPPLNRFHRGSAPMERSSETPKSRAVPSMKHLLYAQGGSFFLWNGYIGDKAYFLRFNILLNEWKKVGPIPMPKSMNLHAVRGTRLLYHRGYNAIFMVMGSLRGIVAGLSNSVYVFYCAGRQKRWIQIQPFNSTKRTTPSRRANHSAVLYKDNSIVVFGGETKTKTGDVELTNDCWIFNIVNNAWRRILTTGDTPPPCAFHAACCSGKHMFISGGKPLSNQIYILNIETKRWLRAQVVDPVPRARFSHHLIPITSAVTSALSFVFVGGATEGGGEGEKSLVDAHFVMIQKLRSTCPTLLEKRNDVDAFYDVTIVTRMSEKETPSHRKKKSMFNADSAAANILNKQLFDSLPAAQPPRSRTPDTFIFENGAMLVSPHDIANQSPHHSVVSRSVPHSRATSRPASPHTRGARRRPSSAVQPKPVRSRRSSTSMGLRSAAKKRPSSARNSARRSSESRDRMEMTRSIYGVSGMRRNSSGRRRSSSAQARDLYTPKRNFVAVESIDAPPTQRASEGHFYSPSSSRPSSGKRRQTSHNVDLLGSENLMNDPEKIQQFLESRMASVHNVLVDREKKRQHIRDSNRV